jgi:hypothetical protein
MVRIAGAQGYYGDPPEGIVSVLDAEPDFVVCEALSELTLAILQKDRLSDPDLGYTKDLTAYLDLVLGEVAAGRLRFVTNAGGINPRSAARAIQEAARRSGHPELRVGVVEGSDLMPQLGRLRELTDGFPHMRTGERFPFGTPAFATAYLGAGPIAAALDAGASVVVTGRVADAALFLGCLIHAYGWQMDDWDRLAAGTVVGHLLECSTQVTGGNLSGPWRAVPDPALLGYPLAEVNENGDAVIFKGSGGGLVNFETVRQQLLYEVEDPRNYLAPDCIADFTSATIKDLGKDEVRISGVKGKPPTASYKALLCGMGGYLGEARVAFAWPDAATKAFFAKDIVLARASSYISAEEGDEVHWEIFGAAKGGAIAGIAGPEAQPIIDELLYEPLADQPSEVVLRVALRTQDKTKADRFQREFNKLGLSGPPGLYGVGRGGSGVSRLLHLWPTLVPKDAVDESVEVRVGTGIVALDRSKGAPGKASSEDVSETISNEISVSAGFSVGGNRAAGKADGGESSKGKVSLADGGEPTEGEVLLADGGEPTEGELPRPGGGLDDKDGPTEPIYLAEFCTARSGDKDDCVNIAVFAPNSEAYDLISRELTAEKVASHLRPLVKGSVARYEAPNVLALNFFCHGALDGGAANSMRSDNLGKAFGSHVLAMRLEIPRPLAERLRSYRRSWLHSGTGS